MDAKKQDLIRKRLERLAALNGGRLTPDAVVQDAKSAKSPLHDQFEWDDSEAARQWRLQQARDLIRSVRIEIEVNERIVSTVCYVRDPRAASEEQGYVEVQKLRTEADLAREAMLRELASASALVMRVQGLAEVLGMVSEAQGVRDSLDRLAAKVAA